jgi:hypothetical protein
MVSPRTRLIAAAVLTAVLLRLAGSQEPYSASWAVLLVGSVVFAALLVREFREYML